MSSSTTYLTPPPRRRSTRTSQSSNSVVADNTLLVDSSDDVSRWRRTLATFLSEACLALDGSFFYLIRSNGWKSLCQLTGLSPEVYSALLLECKLVSIRQNSDGTRSASGENEEWKEFLRLHGLRGDTYGRGGGVEFSTARINTIAIERMEGMNINDATTDTAKGKVSRDMAVLRVGHVDGTGKPPAPTAINRNEDPPRINHAMRKAKTKLCQATVELYSVADSKMQDILVVEDWVYMKTTNTADTTMSKKRKYADDKDDEASAAEIIACSTPSIAVERGALNQTAAGPTASTGANVISPPNITQIQTIQTPPSFTINNNVQQHSTPEQPIISENIIMKQFPSLAKFCPSLLRRGTNVKKGMDLDMISFQGVLSDMVKWCEKFNEPLQFNYANGKHGARLIKLPMSKSNSGVVKPNIQKCIDDLIACIDDREDANVVVIDILIDYLLSKKNKTKTIKNLSERRLVPKVMDEYDCAALLDESGIKIWQWRAIQRCLKLFMGVPQVCVSEKHLRALGTNHGEIKHGVYYYSDPDHPTKVKEEVRYWTKDPVVEFIQILEGIINGYSLNPIDIDYIHLVHGGDHGKLKFRFASKIIISMKNGDSYCQVFGLADVACKKDNGDILHNTCMPALAEGINTIEASTLIFTETEYDKDGGKRSIMIITLVDITDPATTNMDSRSLSIRPTSYLCGDLAFLAIMVGKENFSSQWCNWCMFTKADWQQVCDMNDDKLWDIDKIKQQVDANVADQKKGVDMKGVRSYPLLIIPISRCIFSGLHAGIGIGNRLIEYLEAFIDVDVEQISHEEFQIRGEKIATAQKKEDLTEERKAWMTSPDGEKKLQSNKNRIKRLDIELKRGCDVTTTAAKISEKEKLVIVNEKLTKVRDAFTTDMKRLNKHLKEANDKLDKFTKTRHIGEDSLYTSVDKIFQKFGANRAHYFGRKFEGVDIRKIMTSSDQLFGVDGEIRSKLLQKESRPEVVEKINETCHNIGLALKLWDAAFSAIHAHNPTPEHCNKTQEIIDRAMFQMRKMGFSVTPKMHGMEHHVVTQMRNIPGGLGRLMEHWIEQYHQIGYRLDLAYCRVGSLVGQAAIRSRVEKRGMNPRVQMNKKALQARYVGSRKRRADAIERDEKKVLIKEERRELASVEIDATIDDMRKQDILDKLDLEEELDEMDEMDEIAANIFG